MKNRHFQSLPSYLHLRIDSAHFDEAEADDKILGMAPQIFIILSAFTAIVLTITITAIVLYRRHRARQDYNTNPQLFPHLPDLTFIQEKNLNKKDVKVLFGKPKIERMEEKLDGLSYKVIFNDGEAGGVYFDSIQANESYFQIQVEDLLSPVEIGFVQKDSLQSLKSQNETLVSAGVSINTDGFVVAQGQNIHYYNWNLSFGDVIGIGITQESEKFNERRAWVSKNGMLLNYPPANELDKWLATVDITADEREEYNIGNENVPSAQANKGKDPDKLALEEAKAKAEFEKAQAVLIQQKIVLKTFKKYEFYPVVYFQGNKAENKKKKSQNAKVTVNMNVGGQVFRMQETFFKSGLLK